MSERSGLKICRRGNSAKDKDSKGMHTTTHSGTRVCAFTVLVFYAVSMFNQLADKFTLLEDMV